MRQTILVVDDESDVIDLLRFNLQKSGFDVIEATHGVEALEKARKHRPDVIILDLMLPEIDGIEVCRKLKSEDHTSAIPILMLTAKGTVADRIEGLETGADDYVVKPFSPREIVLRIRALLLRSTQTPDGTLVETGPFSINKNTLVATLCGKKLDLTTTEFKLLALLIDRRGKSIPRETLLREVWGYHSTVDSRTVDTHVRRLREKLGTESSCLETIRGEGYRFAMGT